MKKLLTLNIEGDAHLERVKPFIAEENPDIVCLQEVFSEDVLWVVGAEFQIEFLPMCLKERRDGSLGHIGVAVCTRNPAWKVIRDYYFQPTTTLVPMDMYTKETKRKTTWQGILGVTLDDNGLDMSVCTTHFTWTPDGMSDDFQTHDMRRLLTYMSELVPHVLCGDFNLPRKQNSLYPLLASHYTDHIPEHYETSMYVPLHRVKDDPVRSKQIGEYMVDYILSTPHAYEVSNVEMRGNVSDHYGVVAHIERKV
jgi:endonuclease/exonuclease/phosphatase family metal-dependent hydrolase